MIKFNQSFNIFKRRGLARLTSVILGTALALGGTAHYLQASDHDDGEVDTKGRNLNLTDLYVFREGDQNPSASTDDLVLIMNTNPRSVARQQYYFSTNARYEFHISQTSDKDAPATGQADMTLRFEFDAPNRRQEQRMTVTAIRHGETDTARAKTTPLTDGSPNVRHVSLDGERLSVFAGLREDPFFFDVEQFFRVRAGAAGLGPAVGFRSPEQAVDFTTGYNVNTIAVRVPKAFLQGSDDASVFDIWTTVSVPGQNGEYVQVERLARPAINEGLILDNDFLNALNSVGPDFEAAALAGQNPAARTAGPIVAQAKQTLLAIGNSEERANALLGAFLPDVMRIDTSGPSGYANDLNALGSPVRGRMLADDVIDITLSVLTDGAIATDNVSYAGTPGNPAQGHDPLEPMFPYLALPN
ncbi:MAG: DUF4331 domain-containing protein [Leptolyngbya sp. SIO4C1]|nr:DUF4331 domain-containing protein [Leptolyngbya sp. SIO4C1]